jgi:hypothetical protein
MDELAMTKLQARRVINRVVQPPPMPQVLSPQIAFCSTRMAHPPLLPGAPATKRGEIFVPESKVLLLAPPTFSKHYRISFYSSLVSFRLVETLVNS